MIKPLKQRIKRLEQSLNPVNPFRIIVVQDGETKGQALERLKDIKGEITIFISEDESWL